MKRSIGVGFSWSIITDIRFKGWLSFSHEGFISFSAQWTRLVPHEVTGLDGSYLNKMPQVDFPNDEQYGGSEGPECSF